MRPVFTKFVVINGILYTCGSKSFKIKWNSRLIEFYWEIMLDKKKNRCVVFWCMKWASWNNRFQTKIALTYKTYVLWFSKRFFKLHNARKREKMKYLVEQYGCDVIDGLTVIISMCARMHDEWIDKEKKKESKIFQHIRVRLSD